MAVKVPFSDTCTTFDAYIIPYHNEDILGFNCTNADRLNLYPYGIDSILFKTKL